MFLGGIPPRDVSIKHCIVQQNKSSASSITAHRSITQREQFTLAHLLVLSNQRLRLEQACNATHCLTCTRRNNTCLVLLTFLFAHAQNNCRWSKYATGCMDISTIKGLLQLLFRQVAQKYATFLFPIYWTYYLERQTHVVLLTVTFLSSYKADITVGYSVVTLPLKSRLNW